MYHSGRILRFQNDNLINSSNPLQMRKDSMPSTMTTKSPLPVFLLNDLFVLPDLAYISGSFDPAGRLVHSDVLDSVGGGVGGRKRK